jgi:hypothetical protein
MILIFFKKFKERGMRRGLFVTVLIAMIGVTPHTLEAKATPKGKFEEVKKEKIAKLQKRLERIKKRLECVKKAQNSSQLRECAKKYPLKKRTKKSKKLKKAMTKKIDQKKM